MQLVGHKKISGIKENCPIFTNGNLLIIQYGNQALLMKTQDVVKQLNLIPDNITIKNLAKIGWKIPSNLQ